MKEKLSYVIQITTDDGQGGIYNTTFVISVNDVNENPYKAITLSNNIRAKNSNVRTIIGILSTMDPDNNDTYIYTINAHTF